MTDDPRAWNRYPGGMWGLAPATSEPETTPEMIANGQVWVWLGGADTPHWEMRGTGLVE